jgi:hypothetical protein
VAVELLHLQLALDQVAAEELTTELGLTHLGIVPMVLLQQVVQLDVALFAMQVMLLCTQVAL